MLARVSWRNIWLLLAFGWAMQGCKWRWSWQNGTSSWNEEGPELEDLWVLCFRLLSMHSLCYDQRPHRTIRSHVLGHPHTPSPYSIFTFLLSSILFMMRSLYLFTLIVYIYCVPDVCMSSFAISHIHHRLSPRPWASPLIVDPCA